MWTKPYGMKEGFLIAGGLLSFYSTPFHLLPLLVILLTLTGRRCGKGNLYYSSSFQTARDGIVESIHVVRKET